jgi:hypothetical protein
MNRYQEVQEAAQRRAASIVPTEVLAKQIVAAAQGDARLAYDYLDALNRHVTRLLQGRIGDE